VGTLKPWHDLECVVESLPLVLERAPDVQLAVVGDGPTLPALRGRVRERGLERHVVWAGPVPLERVPDWINAADVCLAPFASDLRDATGISALKVLEYMACARPFVTTRLDSAHSRWVDRHRCGVLVPPHDPRAMAAAITELLADGERRQRLGAQGRRLAWAEHDWGCIAARIERFAFACA
jgi:glycosyltransferase involved in cell wall biosynthesis